MLMSQNRKRSILLLMGLVIALLLGIFALRPKTSPAPLRTLSATQDVMALAFSPDGCLLATGHQVLVRGKDKRGYWAYATGEVQLRHGKDWNVAQTFPFLKKAVGDYDANTAGGPVGWLQFSPDGRLLLVGDCWPGNSGTFGVMDVATGRWLVSRHEDYSRRAQHLYRPLGFSSNGSKVLYLDFLEAKKPLGEATKEEWQKAANTATIVTCEAATGKVLSRSAQVLKPGEWPSLAVLLPDGNTVACATRLGNDNEFYAGSAKLIILDARSGKRLRVSAVSGDLNALVPSSGPYLATVDSTEAVHFLNTAAGTMANMSIPPEQNIWRLAFSPDSKLLAGASWKGDIGLWDMQTGAKLRTLGRHTEFVKQIAFSPDGKTVWSTSQDRTIKVWRVQ